MKESNFKTDLLSPLLFLDRAGKFLKNEVCLIENNVEKSYKEVYDTVLKFKKYLENIEIQPQDKVSIISENCRELVYAHYAVPAAGGVIVCLNPWLNNSQIIEQIEFSESKYVILSASNFERLYEEINAITGVRNIIVIGDDLSVRSEKVHVLKQEIEYYESSGSLLDNISDENDPICINFTSGTTGKPKGVVYSHRAAYLHSLGQVIMFELSSFSNYLWTLPMFHVNGWGHMWAVVAGGGKQVILRDETKISSANIENLIKKKQISHMAGAPRLLEPIIDTCAVDDLAGVKVMIGGASPTKKFIEKVSKSKIKLIHQYGLNETIGPFLYSEVRDSWSREPIEIFNQKLMRQGIPGIHIGAWVKVVNSDGQHVSQDGNDMGQILLAGNTIFSGYYNNLQATKNAFINGWFCTGDMAVVHEDGYVEIKDRMKDLIFVETQYGWENISSIEIENVIQSISNVKDVAIVGKTDNDYGGEKIFAFIELEDNSVPLFDAKKEIEKICSERLPYFKIPNEFIFSEIPKTATGKVKKHELTAAIYAFNQDAEVESVEQS